MGPLGNGFPLKSKKAFLIGGGIGIPPMLELAKQLNCEKQIILGYRNSDMFLLDEFKKQGEVYIATEDGSVGSKEMSWMQSGRMSWMRKSSMRVVRHRCSVH